MKRGQCPKCNSANVFKKKNGIDWGDGSMNIYPGNMSSQSDCDSYVCTDCGYFENYITDKGMLQQIQGNWTKVT
jgi:hypothetical protein